MHCTRVRTRDARVTSRERERERARAALEPPVTPRGAKVVICGDQFCGTLRSPAETIKTRPNPICSNVRHGVRTDARGLRRPRLSGELEPETLGVLSRSPETNVPNMVDSTHQPNPKQTKKKRGHSPFGVTRRTAPGRASKPATSSVAQMWTVSGANGWQELCGGSKARGRTQESSSSWNSDAKGWVLGPWDLTYIADHLVFEFTCQNLQKDQMNSTIHIKQLLKPFTGEIQYSHMFVHTRAFPMDPSEAIHSFKSKLLRKYEDGTSIAYRCIYSI